MKSDLSVEEREKAMLEQMLVRVRRAANQERRERKLALERDELGSRLDRWGAATEEVDA